MAGGPITKDENKILLPTVVQMAADVLSYWTGMTCLYDRGLSSWDAIMGKATIVPISVFQVTKINTTYSVETSRKRIILYEPQKVGARAGSLSDPLRDSIMQTVVDNSVKMPTTYQVEAIVPEQPFGRYVQDGAANLLSIIDIFVHMFGGERDLKRLDYIHTALQYAQQYVPMAQKALKLVPLVNKASRLNIDSLEAMAASCRPLVMKMWSGYQYKYVQITGLSIEKRGNEDGVYRATMTLQEKPILAISRGRTNLSIVRNAAKVLRGVGAMPQILQAGLLDLITGAGIAARVKE